MKILLVTDYYYPRKGGVETVVRNLAKELKSKGHEVNVICANDENSVDEVDGIRVYHLNFIYPRNWKSFFGMITLGWITDFKMAWLLLKLKPDVVNVHFPYSCSPYVLVADLLGFPIVASVHGSEVLKFVDEPGGWNIKEVLRNANAVTACSDWLKYRQEYRDYEVITIPNGVNIPNMRINQPLKKYILAVGRLVEKKGFDALIRAFSMLSGRKNVNLIIVGSGEEYPNLMKLVDGYCLSYRVFIRNNVDNFELNILYDKCEFVVVPSKEEPFGIVALEAMAHGKTVIASGVGGLREIVKNGINGLLVDPNDIFEFRDRMEYLIDNESKKAELEKEALETSKEYDWGKIADRYVEIYERVKQHDEDI